MFNILEEFALLILSILSSPIGFIRWLIYKKMRLKEYIFDVENNIIVFSIISGITFALILISRK